MYRDKFKFLTGTECIESHLTTVMWKFNSDVFQNLACQNKLVCGLAEKNTRMEEGITIRTNKVNEERIFFVVVVVDDDDDDDGEEVTASIFKVTELV